jgi:hypothetical protein
MALRLCALFACLIALPLFCQTPSTNPQVATITAVNVHQGGTDNAVRQYDVTLKLRDAVYGVLYTPYVGTGVEYSVGMNVVVIVGDGSITFTKLGRTHVVPILRRDNVAVSTDLDWSRAPGDYFSQKLQHLSAKLDLTQDQQTKIKPILSQEAGLASQFMANPALTRKDKVDKLDKIVHASDEKLKPVLSADQWQLLQDMRKEQRQELRKSITKKTEGPR